MQQLYISNRNLVIYGLSIIMKVEFSNLPKIFFLIKCFFIELNMVFIIFSTRSDPYSWLLVQFSSSHI